MSLMSYGSRTWSFGIVFCKESHPKGLKHTLLVNFGQPSRSVANDCTLFELATKARWGSCIPGVLY